MHKWQASKLGRQEKATVSYKILKKQNDCNNKKQAKTKLCTIVFVYGKLEKFRKLAAMHKFYFLNFFSFEKDIFANGQYNR